MRIDYRVFGVFKAHPTRSSSVVDSAGSLSYEFKNIFIGGSTVPYSIEPEVPVVSGPRLRDLILLVSDWLQSEGSALIQPRDSRLQSFLFEICLFHV